MKQALTYDLLATDLADYLVRKGLPFRESHHVAGEAVRESEVRKTPLNQLGPEVYAKLHPLFGDGKEVGNAQWWDFERSVEARNVEGGTSRSSCLEQIAKLKQALLL